MKYPQACMQIYNYSKAVAKYIWCSRNISKLEVRNLLKFQHYLLIINLYLTTKEKQSLLAINFNQFLPAKTCQMCLFWRQTPVSKSCPPLISFNVNGIQNLLSNLDCNKAHGPDGISPYMLKSCSAEIAPILEIIFKQ